MNVYSVTLVGKYRNKDVENGGGGERKNRRYRSGNLHLGFSFVGLLFQAPTATAFSVVGLLLLQVQRVDGRVLLFHHDYRSGIFAHIPCPVW